jgi:hypothetical protein
MGETVCTHTYYTYARQERNVSSAMGRLTPSPEVFKGRALMLLLLLVRGVSVGHSGG